jgi:ADP-ribose pyrophosphatase YjhB (NUDIX family)
VHRRPLLALLRAHRPSDEDENGFRERIIDFVEANPSCFERSLLSGHITGSAWVTSRADDRVILVHHGKLERWLQPGGHCDGDSDVSRVAWREASEETGLRSIEPASLAIYDVDVHAIPARETEPAHFHYDVRFRFCADPDEAPLASAESRAVRWVDLEEARRLSGERSVLRMIEKMQQARRAREEAK